jgi:hypothetical protein
MECCRLKWTLNIRASSFLDETWYIPNFRRYQLVPSNRLGITIESVHGRIVVSGVDPGSVGDEHVSDSFYNLLKPKICSNDLIQLRIEPGDIIDDLCGRALRSATTTQAINLIRMNKGMPIHISIIKVCLSAISHLIFTFDHIFTTYLQNDQR